MRTRTRNLRLFLLVYVLFLATATNAAARTDDRILQLKRSELRKMKEIQDFMVDFFFDPTSGNVDKRNAKRDQALSDFKEEARYSWAVSYHHLIRFLELATTSKNPNPEKACLELKKAVLAYEGLDELGFSGAAQARKVYREALGIDEAFFKQLYETDYAKRKNFIYQGDCPCDGLQEAGTLRYKGQYESTVPFLPEAIMGELPKVPHYRELDVMWERKTGQEGWLYIPNSNAAGYQPDTVYETTSFRRKVRLGCEQNWLASRPVTLRVKPEPPRYDTLQLPVGTIYMNESGAEYKGKNGEFKDADNVIGLLRKLVNHGSLNTDLFEIRQLVEGDNRWIPGQNGVPYELTFKHEETHSTIVFPTGEYVIEDTVSNGNKWKPYKESMNMISTCIIRILEQFGGSSFLIMTQGKADAPTFSPKPLEPGYDHDMFTNIPVLSYEHGRGLVEKTVSVGATYDNDELPELRAAFLANAILKRDFMRAHQEKVLILKGHVMPNENPKQRNASIVIWIDWEAAEKTFKQQHPPKKPNFRK